MNFLTLCEQVLQEKKLIVFYNIILTDFCNYMVKYNYILII